jgi:hypothetical protein
MKKILANNKLMLIGLIILVALICVVNGCKEDATSTVTDTDLGGWWTANSDNVILFTTTGSVYSWYKAGVPEAGTYKLKDLEITFTRTTGGTTKTYEIKWKDDKKDEMTLTNKDDSSEKYTFKKGGGITSSS